MQVNTKFLEAEVASSDADIGEEIGTTEMKARARIIRHNKPNALHI